MHFLDPKNDYSFKQVFGNKNKKNVLISFLNHVLNKHEADLITDVTLLNPHQAPHLKGTKETILDVSCHDQSGAEYIVEMQVLYQAYFDKRALYYSSKAYSEQLDSGDDFPTLKPVIFIGILNFDFTKEEDYISQHRILNIKTSTNSIQDFDFTFIELPKFNKNEHELKTITEQWVYFLKNAYKLNAIPEEIHEEAVQEAFNIVERASWTREQLALYDASEKTRRNREMEILGGLQQGMEEGLKKGREEGRQEGLEKGREEGEKKGKIAVALNLLEQGIDEKTVTQATGLSSRELKELQRELSSNH